MQHSFDQELTALNAVNCQIDLSRGLAIVDRAIKKQGTLRAHPNGVIS
jgi:hypothetical protein